MEVSQRQQLFNFLHHIARPVPAPYLMKDPLFPTTVPYPIHARHFLTSITTLDTTPPIPSNIESTTRRRHHQITIVRRPSLSPHKYNDLHLWLHSCSNTFSHHRTSAEILGACLSKLTLGLNPWSILLDSINNSLGCIPHRHSTIMPLVLLILP